MTKETKIASLLLKGLVSELTSDDQEKIKSLVNQISQIVKENGDNGTIALTIAALENTQS